MWVLALLLGRRGSPLDLLDFDRLNGGARLVPDAGAAPRRVPPPLIACTGLLLATALAYGPLTERQQIIPDRPGLVTFPLQLGGWRGEPIPVTDDAVLRALGASDHLLVDYAAPGGGATVNLWVAYYGQQLGKAAIHSPKDCLPGGGWEYVSFETIPSPVPGRDGAPFMINRGVIAKGLDQMVIYYWLDMRGRKLTNDITLKLYNLWDSYALGRSDGALVRLLSPVGPGETVADADRRMQELLMQAYPALEPHVGA
jgi:EpsI family protein